MSMSYAKLNAELARVRELEAELAGRLASMTTEERIKALEAAQPVVKPKSKELAALLESGYGFSIETAKKIVAERDANPQAWPLERYDAAKAMLAAYEAKPQVISTRRGWKRSRG